MKHQYNPGSAEAYDRGCLCPVMDNCRGRFPPIPAGSIWGGADGGWYIRLDCPLHGEALALGEPGAKPADRA